eukprot:1958899-Prymnesium_polylepis.1
MRPRVTGQQPDGSQSHGSSLMAASHMGASNSKLDSGDVGGPAVFYRGAWHVGCAEEGSWAEIYVSS